ncbi:MAG: MBL fold metallo-hydrolase [Clostridiales bacterium]|nr:MBL fold metallo-hydrolase [Clostridiales bacterium]
MMLKRRLIPAVLMGVILLNFWVWVQGTDTAPEPEGGLMITALPVGKADCILIRTEEQTIVVDTGEKDDGDALVQELKSQGISRVDLLLVTHFDKDHVGGAAYLMEHMEVASVCMPDYEGDRPEYGEFMESLQGHPDMKRLSEQMSLSVGEMELVIYPAADPEALIAKKQEKGKEYDNDLSLVMKLTYGTKSFLFTGDIEKERIAQMLAQEEDWSCDWIKMPHHGEYQKSLKELLDAAMPSAAVICCSVEEPAEEKTLKLLEERGIPVWDTSGQTAVTVCDGEELTVRYE